MWQRRVNQPSPEFTIWQRRRTGTGGNGDYGREYTITRDGVQPTEEAQAFATIQALSAAWSQRFALA